MAGIVLGAHGIWVEPELVPTAGGQSPRYPKVEIMVSVVWAVASQVIEAQM